MTGERERAVMAELLSALREEDYPQLRRRDALSVWHIARAVHACGVAGCPVTLAQPVRRASPRVAGPRPRPVPMRPVIIRPPADRILARVAPDLHRIGITDALRIGGDTALAARWNHRCSTDIDMVMTPEFFRAAAAPLTRLLQAHPGTQIRQGQGWLNAMVPDGDFSIMTAEALLADDGPPERESVFGLALESTAQILARKLRYRMWGNGEFVARDLYDLCTGAVRDPAAVARALGVLDPCARTAPGGRNRPPRTPGGSDGPGPDRCRPSRMAG